MSKSPLIGIQSYACFSALGSRPDETLDSYLNGKTRIANREINGRSIPVAPLHPSAEKEINKEDYPIHGYKTLDRTTRAAIACSTQVFELEKPNKTDQFIINIGSSRGATHSWEKFYSEFKLTERLSPKASPFTTLGNISSFTAAALNLEGFHVDHSITCSTGLQALANSLAWLRSGMATEALAGASEAPLTDFSIAQMSAIGIYSSYQDEFPCKSAYVGPDKRNSMVLGEASAMFYLKPLNLIPQNREPVLYIESIGAGNEYISSPTSVSTEGLALKKAMTRALKDMSTPDLPDCIVLHAPGTIQGDESEWQAIQSVFGSSIPALTCNKWLAGHTLGSSGLLSVEMALLMLRHQIFFPIPYSTYSGKKPKKLQKIMVNAQGFGGNAISFILAVKN